MRCKSTWLHSSCLSHKAHTYLVGMLGGGKRIVVGGLQWMSTRSLWEVCFHRGKRSLCEQKFCCYSANVRIRLVGFQNRRLLNFDISVAKTRCMWSRIQDYVTHNARRQVTTFDLLDQCHCIAFSSCIPWHGVCPLSNPVPCTVYAK